MLRSTVTIISAGSPCRRNAAVLVCLRGFRGVVLVVRVVTVFDLVRRCVSRDGPVDLARDLRPQLLGHRGMDFWTVDELLNQYLDYARRIVAVVRMEGECIEARTGSRPTPPRSWRGGA